MDLYPAIILFYLFQPQLLHWPEKDNGQVSLKLEDLNAANQLAGGHAHDAMHDVEATLALAKRLAESDTLWQYLQGYFQKKLTLNACKKSSNRGHCLFAANWAPDSFSSRRPCYWASTVTITINLSGCGLTVKPCSKQQLKALRSTHWRSVKNRGT